MDFKIFVIWYRHNYYTSKCPNNTDPLKCYIGAIDNNNIINTKKYFEKLDDNEWPQKSIVGFIVPSQLLHLVSTKKNVLQNESNIISLCKIVNKISLS